MSAWHRTDPNVAAKERQRAELRTRSPLRAPADQRDAAHLPLFVAASEPSLF